MPRTALRMVPETPERRTPTATAVHVQRQFGKRVAQRRADLRMTQETMMKLLNHLSGGTRSRSSVAMWESGDAPPDIVAVYYLAKVLKTRPEYLAYGVKMLESPSLLAQAHSVVIGEPVIPRTARIKPVRKLQRQVMVRRAWSGSPR